MSAVDVLRTMWEHAAWADAEMIRAVGNTHDANPEAWRECQHILGAAERWLSRLEQREPRAPVWPSITAQETEELRTALARDYAALLSRLTDDALPQVVTYTTSDGRVFTNTVGDILTHAVLHGQYHRGKINLLLRQHDAPPAPVDFIAYVRGAPAATQASAAGG